MATIRKRKNKSGDTWQAIVRRNGYKPISATFDIKEDAEKWARAQEREMDRGAFIPSDTASRMTVRKACEKYAEDILPSKRGVGPDKSRLDRLEASLGNLSLAALEPSHVAEYRDRRLKEVGPQSVKHEINLLQRVLKACVLDWGIHLPRGIVTEQVRKPQPPPSSKRDRRYEGDEEERLLDAAKNSRSKIAEKVIRFAIETGMRRGEIASMAWPDVNLVEGTLHIPETKTDSPRTIPLTDEAVMILRDQRRQTGLRADKKVWGVRADSISKMFSRLCKKVGIENLRLHDSRHETASRLAEAGFTPFEISAVTGQKSWETIKRYTHVRPSSLRDKVSAAIRIK